MTVDDASTAKRVRELLGSGRLPSRYPDHVWGGRGSGRDTCLVCGSVVSPHQVVMEAVFIDEADASRSLFFHGSCFWAVEPEWRQSEHAVESSDRGGSGTHEAGMRG